MPDAVFTRIDQLLQRPGYAVKIRDRLNRVTDSELLKRKEQFDKITAIVEEIDLPQKQRDIAELQSQQKNAEAHIRELEIKVNQGKDSYYRLNNQYLETRNQLQERANLSSEEVEVLKSEITSLQLSSSKAQGDVKRLEDEKDRELKEIERLNATIMNRDATIKARDEELEKERLELTTQRESIDKLNREYRELLNQKATDIGAQGALDKKLELEKQTRQNAEAKYDDLRKKYDGMEVELKAARQFEGQANTLESEKRNLERLISDREAVVVQLQQSVETEQAKVNDWVKKFEAAEQAKGDLDQTLKQSKSDARAELDKAINQSQVAMAGLRQQLENATESLNDSKTSATKEKAEFREKIFLLEQEISTLKNDKSYLHSEKTGLQKDHDNLAERLRELKDNFATLGQQKRDTDRQLLQLERLNEKYESGKGAIDSALAAARQEVTFKSSLLDEQTKKTENVQEEFYQYKKLILKYVLGGLADFPIDFKNVNTTLETAISPNTTLQTIQRAVQLLEPFFIGLEIPPVLSGFQLWLEAINHPKDFTPVKVLAYLQGAHAQDFTDAGFLWLVVGTLTSRDRASLRGLPAFAVLVILQFWLYVDPSEECKSKISEACLSLPTFTDTNLDHILNKIEWHVEGRGHRDPNRSATWGSVALSSLTTKDAHLNLDSEYFPTMKFVRLDDVNPVYFIFVMKDRIVWLRPENITVRVDVSQEVCFIYDNLDPHLIPERQLPFTSNNLPKISSVLKGVTYLV